MFPLALRRQRLTEGDANSPPFSAGNGNRRILYFEPQDALRSEISDSNGSDVGRLYIKAALQFFCLCLHLFTAYFTEANNDRVTAERSVALFLFASVLLSA